MIDWADLVKSIEQGPFPNLTVTKKTCFTSYRTKGMCVGPVKKWKGLQNSSVCMFKKIYRRDSISE